MKVIFLDVDGVLDIFNTEQYMQVLLKDAVQRLKRIVDETDAKIVVASNWRYGCDRYKDRIKDLKRYPQIESFVILDDCFSDDYSQYPQLQKKLVFVDANQALQDCDVEKAVGILQDM